MGVLLSLFSALHGETQDKMGEMRKKGRWNLSKALQLVNISTYKKSFADKYLVNFHSRARIMTFGVFMQYESLSIEGRKRNGPLTFPSEVTKKASVTDPILADQIPL